MTPYVQALRDFKIRYVLRAVEAAGGNMCEAARATGMHRNTVLRTVRSVGYESAAPLRQFARNHNILGPKPVASAELPASVAERRRA